jgi:hypothetical protein
MHANNHVTNGPHRLRLTARDLHTVDEDIGGKVYRGTGSHASWNFLGHV